jgi:hypothetical protein
MAVITALFKQKILVSLSLFLFLSLTFVQPARTQSSLELEALSDEKIHEMIHQEHTKISLKKAEIKKAEKRWEKTPPRNIAQKLERERMIEDLKEGIGHSLDEIANLEQELAGRKEERDLAKQVDKDQKVRLEAQKADAEQKADVNLLSQEPSKISEIPEDLSPEKKVELAALMADREKNEKLRAIEEQQSKQETILFLSIGGGLSAIVLIGGAILLVRYLRKKEYSKF